MQTVIIPTQFPGFSCDLCVAQENIVSMSPLSCFLLFHSMFVYFHSSFDLVSLKGLYWVQYCLICT